MCTHSNGNFRNNYTYIQMLHLLEGTSRKHILSSYSILCTHAMLSSRIHMYIHACVMISVHLQSLGQATLTSKMSKQHRTPIDHAKFTLAVCPATCLERCLCNNWLRMGSCLSLVWCGTESMKMWARTPLQILGAWEGKACQVAKQ